jgi:hypothetical protein
VDIDNCTKSREWLGARHITDDFDKKVAGTVECPNPQESIELSTKFEPMIVSMAPPKAGLDVGNTRMRTGIGWHTKSGTSTKWTPLLLTLIRVIPNASGGIGHCTLLEDTNEAWNNVVSILQESDGLLTKLFPLIKTLYPPVSKPEDG